MLWLLRVVGHGPPGRGEGAIVQAVVDRDELAGDTNKRCLDAVDTLKGEGVSVHPISGHRQQDHRGRDREIVEGPFNWLSAVWEPALRGIRHETSW